MHFILFINSTRNDILYRLLVSMCNSLLCMAQNIRSSQACIDNIGLKVQRDKKRRKDKLVLQANLTKVSKEHVEGLFHENKYINSEF